MAERPMTLQLASTDELINELMARHEHIVMCMRSIPVQGQNEAVEGIFQRGDYRTCQGMAMGIVGWCQNHMMLSMMQKLSHDQQEDAPDERT